MAIIVRTRSGNHFIQLDSITKFTECANIEKYQGGIWVETTQIARYKLKPFKIHAPFGVFIKDLENLDPESSQNQVLDYRDYVWNLDRLEYSQLATNGNADIS